jgi:hypothetical protein
MLATASPCTAREVAASGTSTASDHAHASDNAILVEAVSRFARTKLALV